MEFLLDENLVKSIGLSNFSEEQRQRIVRIVRSSMKCKFLLIILNCSWNSSTQNRRFCSKLSHRVADRKNCRRGKIVIGMIVERSVVQPAAILLRYISERRLISND